LHGRRTNQAEGDPYVIMSCLMYWTTPLGAAHAVPPGLRLRLASAVSENDPFQVQPLKVPLISVLG